MHDGLLKIQATMLLCCFLLPHVEVLGNGNSTQAINSNSSDLQAPGEAPLPARESNEDHPWTIVEMTPAFENSRESVKPELLDSPRSLMWSLGRTLNTYRGILEEEGRTFESEPRLQWIQSRIAQCFDLSDIGPQFQSSVATDAAVYLREIMRRIPMSAWETIPDRNDIENMPISERITRYRFDYVPIELRVLTEGERQGEWVITTETRDTAQDAFEHVKNIQPIAGVGELYRRHFFEPGWMIPADWINDLPSWTGHEIFEQAIWQWFITILSLLVLAGGVLVALLLLRKRCRQPLTITGRILHLIFLIVVGVLSAAFIDFLQFHVFLSGDILEIFIFFCSGIMAIAFVLGLLNFGVLVAEIVISSPKINPKSLDAALIRIAARTISILLAAIVFFQILGQLGFSPATILAGAGVTGLAIALAAQDTLKNFFASIILLMERPFSEGERIQIGEDLGTVESIGLRSTNIRTRDGHVVSLPNEIVAHGRIENISRRPYIRNDFSIGIVYSTPIEKIEKAVQIIRDILDEKSEAPHQFEPLVFFTKFEDSSLVIECSYWQSTTDFSKSQQTAQSVNLAIIEQFATEEIEFAYPTITIVNEETSRSDLHSDH